jgi:hypothetical protein
MANWFTGNESTRDGAVRIIHENSTKKYLITNKSDIKIGGMHIVSTNECRWVLQVKEIRETYYVVELLTMGNIIKETNNPMVKDVAGFNNMFKEIYNELVLEISLSGELLAVKNPTTIRNKWKIVREQMKNLAQHQKSVADVIKINDDIFDDDKKLFEVIKATELFELFFIGFYGKVLPGMRKVERPNKFKGSKFEWNYEFVYAENRTETAKHNLIDINLNGFVSQNFSKANIEKIYGKFDFINYNTIKPTVNCNGKYSLNLQTGMIEKAMYNNYEIIDENQLYSKNEYLIETYD